MVSRDSADKVAKRLASDRIGKCRDGGAGSAIPPVSATYSSATREAAS